MLDRQESLIQPTRMRKSFFQHMKDRIAKKETGVFGHVRWLNALDRFLISEMHQWGIQLLRVTLGGVYLWFGALKVFGVTPVVDLVQQTYSFLPTNDFLLILGCWEVLIGVGLISKKCLRTTLALLWLQMAGTFVSVFLAPSLFFLYGNPFLLTVLGEFIIKNIVLTASGLVIGGYEIKRKVKNGK